MDIEKLIETLRQHGVSCVRAHGRYCSICDEAATALSTLQAENDKLRADVVEVRHGRWIGLEYDGYADGCPVYDLWECSECGEEVRGEDVPSTHPWCHSCGARMDKEDEHEIP